jgi:iron complex transport system permease protein
MPRWGLQKNVEDLTKGNVVAYYAYTLDTHNIQKQGSLRFGTYGGGVGMHRKVCFITLGGILFLLCVGSLFFGRYPLSPGRICAFFLSSSGEEEPILRTLLWEVRFPRIGGALCVGGALAVSGAAYQNLFRNPLVSPGILGVSAGASFGAALGMLWGCSWNGIQGMAFLCALLAVGGSFLIFYFLGRRSMVVLVLGGMVVSALFQAFLSLVKFLADPLDTLPGITFWLMGGLSRMNRGDLASLMLPLLGGMGCFILFRWQIHGLSLGEEEARALGIPLGKIRCLVILGSTLMTAVAISVSGIIGWIGLLIPHVARVLVGSSFPVLLPASFLLGGIFLLLVDDLGRIMSPGEIPLGILTSLVGAPFFVLLLAKARKEWN